MGVMRNHWNQRSQVVAQHVNQLRGRFVINGKFIIKNMTNDNKHFKSFWGAWRQHVVDVHQTFNQSRNKSSVWTHSVQPFANVHQQTHLWMSNPSEAKFNIPGWQANMDDATLSESLLVHLILDSLVLYHCQAFSRTLYINTLKWCKNTWLDSLVAHRNWYLQFPSLSFIFIFLLSIVYVFMPLFVFCSSSSLLSLLFLRDVFFPIWSIWNVQEVTFTLHTSSPTCVQ